MEKFGLEIHPTKSRKKFTAKCKAMNDWLRSVRNSLPTPVLWKTLRAKLRGHYQYYGVSENIHGIGAFYRRTLCMAKKWLNRRSQKGRGQMSWSNFNDFLKINPLPEPVIVNDFYALSMLRRKLGMVHFLKVG